MAKDLYETLGVNKNNFSEQELKTNYRKLSRKYHPDMQKGKSKKEQQEAEEKFKEISHAYEVLSDPEKKNNYDMFGDENGQASGMGGFNPFGGGFNPFGDFFNPFGGGARHSSFNNVQPGKNIQMKIPVTIEELFNGLKKTVKYTKQVRCINCHGSGGTGQKPCPKCHGTGRFTKREMHNGWQRIEETVCPHCGGSGMIVENKCSTCNGTGFSNKEVTLDIEFPPGIPNNTGIVFNDKGSESKSVKGENGDFIAITNYKIDSDKYEVNGLNVVEHVYIPYYDILLGCSYTVHIPNGKSKIIKIASCTKEGKVMRLQGQGIKSNTGQQGDYYVCIHYQIPEYLKDKEVEHLEIIKNLH
jgi:molecular chaperone DnaJ